jgi:predicted Zn-dependent protease
VADDTEWEWEFHVLDAPDLVNAFALPGGQIFITTALLERFEGEGDIAAVLAHEIVHVLGRHSAEQMAKAELTNGLVGAVAVASGDASATQAAAVFGQLINMKYSRDHEHQADTIGICLLIDAGYPPEEMIDVMQVLAQASGGQAPPEFMSTHPSSDNRIEEIEEAIANADEDCPD